MAPNVLDLLDQPLMSCPDHEETCGLLLGEKTTKVFALDSSSGNLRWANSKFKFAGAGAGAGEEGVGAPPTSTPAGGGKEPPILMQRDDYVVRSLNVQTGREEWNVTLSEIFAIGHAADGASAIAAAAGARGYYDAEAEEDDGEEEGRLPLLPDMDWVDERTLEVVDPETGEVLWARELHAAPIGMYTVMDNKWLHLDLPSQGAGAAAAEPSRRVGGGRLLTGGDATVAATGGTTGSVVGARLGGNQLAPGGPIATARAARKYGLGSLSRVGLPRVGGGGGAGRGEDGDEEEGEDRLVVRAGGGTGGGAFEPLRRMLDYTPLARLLGKGGKGGGGSKLSSSSSSSSTTTSVALVEQRPPQSRRPGRRQRRCSQWEIAHGRCADPGEGRTGDHGVYDVMVTSPFCPDGEGGHCPRQPWELPDPASQPLRLGPPGGVGGEPGKGLYMTFETLATLVIAVFVVGILFVLTVYQHHQLGLGRAGAAAAAAGKQQQSSSSDPGSETLQRLADLVLKHRQSSAGAGGLLGGGLDPGASENTAATTASSSSVFNSGSSLGEGGDPAAAAAAAAAAAEGKPFYQRGRPALLALTAGGERSGASTPRPSPTRGLYDAPSSRGSQGSQGSGGEGLPRSTSMPVFAGAEATTSTPRPRQQPAGRGGSGLLLEKEEHVSMEGQPIQRLQAVYKERSPPLSANGRGAFFPEATGGAGKLAAAEAGAGAVSAAASSATMSTALVPASSAAGAGAGTRARTASSGVATETITDASGNPVLFLSRNRYKNEFHETTKLGRGGFGTVFRSTNKLDGHDYAIKKIRLSSAAAWSTQLEKVLREVKILALLDHPNIIRYYQAWLERLSPEDLQAAALAAAAGATGASASATLSLLAPGGAGSSADSHSHSQSLSQASHTLGGHSGIGGGGFLSRLGGAHDLSWGGLPAVGGGGGRRRNRRARRLNSSSSSVLSPLRYGKDGGEHDEEEEEDLEEESDEEEESEGEGEDGDEEDDDTVSSSGVGLRAPTLPPRARPPLPPGAGGSVVAAALRRNTSAQSDEHSRISQWSEEDDESLDAEEEEDDEENTSASGSLVHYRPSETDDDSQGGLVVWTRAPSGDGGGGGEEEGTSRPGTPNAGASAGGSSSGRGDTTPRRQDRPHLRGPSSPFSPSSASASASSSRALAGPRGAASALARGANGSNGGLRRNGRGGGGGGRTAAGRRSSSSAAMEAVVFDLCLYIQMQFCSNRTLKDFLELPERRVQVDKAQALQLALQIARGVQYVHERGLIHRDLKPTNCFLVGGNGASGSNGGGGGGGGGGGNGGISTSTVKIGDFGLSRHVGGVAGAAAGAEEGNPPPLPPLSPTARRSGRGGRYVDYDNTAGVGTPVYGSPEQLSGGDYDEKTDVFSLGVMLFELFHPAFGTGMERMLTMRRLHEGRLPEEWSQGNAELVDVVQRMLNRLPSRRPTAAEVVGKLEFLQGRPLVLPLEFDSFPRDAVLLRAETGERDGMLQEVISGIKAHGAAGLMKQYGFRSSSDGRAVIEVLLDGSRAGEIDRILAHLRALDDMLACNIVGLGPGGSSSSSSAVSRAPTVEEAKREEAAAVAAEEEEAAS